MLLLLFALSATAPRPAPVKVEQRARASVTILRSHEASPQTWKPASRPDQREILKKEPDGEEVRLRLTEFQ
jgi:hypothetical protein